MSFAGSEYSKEGWDRSLNNANGVSAIAGATEHEECDTTSGDVVPTMLNCRCVYADGAGRIKIDYLTAKGETKTEVLEILAGLWYPIRNVTKVYQIASAATILNSSASLVNGLKLRR